jgi:bifunctional DNA-binding transcriptional regulator/antitoxin component of YhaV-PrlF toxin-antitoxin module
MSTNPYQGKTYKAKVTGRHAITLPAALCREMGIEVGDTVELEVSGLQAILRLEDEEPEVSLRGILKDYFPDMDSVMRFLEEERAGWDEQTDQVEEPVNEDEHPSPD